jgi:hypothetical protein
VKLFTVNNFMGKPLTQAQLEQRRAAAKARGAQLSQDTDHQRQASAALREQVSSDYYRFIGRIGGRRTMYNRLMEVAANWGFTPDEIQESRVSPERRAELEADMRSYYRERAIEKYGTTYGNRVMLALFPPEQESEGTRKRRRKSKKQA